MNGENGPPVVFHIDDGPASRGGFVQRFIQVTDLGISIVGEFAHRIGVMHETVEIGAGSGRRPFEHLLIAIRISKRGNGPAADDLVNVFGLPFFVVDGGDGRGARQDRRAVANR